MWYTLIGMMPLVMLLCGQAAPPAGLGTEAGEMGTLRVQVQYVGRGGASQQGSSPSLRVLGPAAAEVVAVPAGQGAGFPLAALTTDAAGTGVLALPPGTYWLFVPVPADPPRGLTAPIVRELPDGTRTLGWAPVDVAAGVEQAVTISIERLMP